MALTVARAAHPACALAPGAAPHPPWWVEPAQRGIPGQHGGILGSVEAWPELVELFEYKVRDVLEDRVPNGGQRSLRALRYTLLGAALPPPLHRRVVVADRNYRAHLRGEPLPDPAVPTPAVPVPDLPASGTPGPELPVPESAVLRSGVGASQSEGSDLSATWTELHLLAWHTQAHRTLTRLARDWQQEPGRAILRVLYTALENAERNATLPRLSVPGAHDPLVSLHDPEILGRLVAQTAQALLTGAGRAALRDSLVQVREEPFPPQEGQGTLDAHLRAAGQEATTPAAQAQLVSALRASRPAQGDPRERPAIREAASSLLSALDDLLRSSPPLMPGRVPDGAVLFLPNERLGCTLPDPQATELVVALRGGSSVTWRGHDIRWLHVGEHWQFQSGGQACLLRGDAPLTDRRASLKLHGAALDVYLSGDHALLHLEVPPGRALEERAGLARLVAALLDPAQEYAALRLARATAALLRGGTLDASTLNLAALGPESAERYRLASGEALLDFTRRGAETLLARLLLQPGQVPDPAEPLPELREASRALNLPEALQERLWARLYGAAVGGEAVGTPTQASRVTVAAGGEYTGVLVGPEPVTLAFGGRLEGRVLTLRTDYRGELMAAMPGLPAAALRDLLVLRVPGGSVLLVREGAHVAAAVEEDAAPDLKAGTPANLAGRSAVSGQPG